MLLWKARRLQVRRIGVVLFWIILCFITLAAACQKASPTYLITDPFQYPVVPGMEEWTQLGSLQEKAAVCQIPEDILGNMTTQALVETVANYPLWINVMAYEDRQLGLEHVKSYFNGLQELSTRKDAIEEIETYIAERLAFSEDDPESEEKSLKIFKTWYLEVILEDLRSNSSL